MTTMTRRILLAATLAVAVGAQAAGAQTTSNKPITLVNPYAVGGPADHLARALAKGLSDQLGQPVVVENRSGGGASIGAAHVAKAAPDGTTLLLGTSAAHVITPMTTRVPYDGIKDFDFLGIVANVPNMLVVHPDVPAADLQAFIALAKSQPAKINYASAGQGSSPHIGMELFKLKTGTDLQHVPYRGAAPAVTDLVAGTVQVGMLNVSGVQAFVKDGRLRALAYGGTQRIPNLPDVPTFPEAGIPDFTTGSWYSLATPAGTPVAARERIAKALDATLHNPEFVAAANQQNAELLPMTPAQTLTFVQRDAKAMQDLLATPGMTLTD